MQLYRRKNETEKGIKINFSYWCNFNIK